jgi:hypothetical protein
MGNRNPSRLVLVAAGCAWIAAPAAASVVTPLDVEALARRSPVIVTGEVTSIRSVRESSPERIDTYVGVRVETPVKGADHLSEVTLKQPGGVWGGQASVVYGAPSFELGERVLVFAVPTASGHLRVAGLFQGKYRIEPAASGELLAIQDAGVGARSVGAAVGGDRIALAELLSRIGSVPGETSAADPAGSRIAVAPTPMGGEAHETTAPFTLLNPLFALRWFEPDTGLPVSFSYNPSGAPAVPSGARAGFEAALGAWTGVEGAAMTLSDGGDTTASCFGFDGTAAVSHGDPCDQMEAFDTDTCSGVLAIGGVSWLALQTKRLNGVDFLRITEADVVLNGGIDCFMAFSGNYAEVVTHELGHAQGLGHSCGDANSPACGTDPVLDDAQMRAFAHGDGRGADPRADDVDGLRYLYPPAAFVDLGLNASSFATGEDLVVTIDLNGTAQVDLYVFSLLPGGSFYYSGAPALNTVAPLATNLPLGFYPDLTSTATFAGSEPSGSYTLGVFLAAAGSDPFVPGSILAGDQVSYTFTP